MLGSCQALCERKLFNYEVFSLSKGANQVDIGCRLTHLDGQSTILTVLNNTVPEADNETPSAINRCEVNGGIVLELHIKPPVLACGDAKELVGYRAVPPFASEVCAFAIVGSNGNAFGRNSRALAQIDTLRVLLGDNFRFNRYLAVRGCTFVNSGDVVGEVRIIDSDNLSGRAIAVKVNLESVLVGNEVRRRFVTIGISERELNYMPLAVVVCYFVGIVNIEVACTTGEVEAQLVVRNSAISQVGLETNDEIIGIVDTIGNSSSRFVVDSAPRSVDGELCVVGNSSVLSCRVAGNGSIGSRTNVNAGYLINSRQRIGVVAAIEIVTYIAFGSRRHNRFTALRFILRLQIDGCDGELLAAGCADTHNLIGERLIANDIRLTETVPVTCIAIAILEHYIRSLVGSDVGILNFPSDTCSIPAIVAERYLYFACSAVSLLENDVQSKLIRKREILCLRERQAQIVARFVDTSGQTCAGQHAFSKSSRALCFGYNFSRQVSSTFGDCTKECIGGSIGSHCGYCHCDEEEKLFHTIRDLEINKNHVLLSITLQNYCFFAKVRYE